MLNTCLTVRAHEANSHKDKGWERFTQKVIDTVCKVRVRGVVFLAWGTPAQKRCAKVNAGKHLVLKAQHPSPLSAHRPPGFMSCGHFRKTNEWLVERYGEDGGINWDLNKPNPIATPKAGGPAKKTENQKGVAEPGLGTDLPVDKNEEPKVPEDEFDEDDDTDAMEAWEELANSSANGEIFK